MLMMAVVVSLLSGSGDTPDVRLSPVGMKTAEECANWQKNMASVELTVIDPITGRQLLARQYQCLDVQATAQ